MYLYTINGTGDSNLEEKFYYDLHEAENAWIKAGRPSTIGSSVWVTEHMESGGDVLVTVRTVTLLY
jgi:hypothetical protein